MGTSRNFSISEKATISSKQRIDFRFAHAQDRAVEVNILSPGKFWMKIQRRLRAGCPIVREG